MSEVLKIKDGEKRKYESVISYQFLKDANNIDTKLAFLNKELNTNESFNKNGVAFIQSTLDRKKITVILSKTHAEIHLNKTRIAEALKVYNHFFGNFSKIKGFYNYNINDAMPGQTFRKIPAGDAQFVAGTETYTELPNGMRVNQLPQYLVSAHVVMILPKLFVNDKTYKELENISKPCKLYKLERQDNGSCFIQLVEDTDPFSFDPTYYDLAIQVMEIIRRNTTQEHPELQVRNRGVRYIEQ